MSLVQYSDSDSDAEPASPPAKKPGFEPRPSLPPLPAAFHDLYASSTRVSVKDDPSLHGGRKRVIPHVEGNWPSHLYLEWYPAKNELALLADLIAQARGLDPKEQSIHSLLHSDLGAQLPLHISLSRPVVLRTEQRRPFTELLQKSIRDSHIAPFSVLPDTLKWVSNYEKTRWFLVLHVAKPPNDELNYLLHSSNRALESFDQPPLYAPSSDFRARASGAHDRRTDYSECFHISIAWSLDGPGVRDAERVAAIDLKPAQDLEVRFDSVKAKIGNHVESIPLPAT